MEAKLTFINYGPDEQVYYAQIDDKQVIIADLDGDGQITLDNSGDDSTVTTYAIVGNTSGVIRVGHVGSSNIDADFIWDGSGYASDEHLIETARTLVSDFRNNLLNEMRILAGQLENAGWETDSEYVEFEDKSPRICGVSNHYLVRSNERVKVFDFDENGTADYGWIVTSGGAILLIQAAMSTQTSGCRTVDLTRHGVDEFLSPFDLFYWADNS